LVPSPRAALARRKLPLIFAGLVAGVTTLACPVAQAEALRRPACAELASWAAKFDRNDEWRASPDGARHRFARIFAQEETAKLFGKPLASWTEADVNAIRDTVLACRRETKDRDLSGRYNQVQSALVSRVANFARESVQARERAAAAMGQIGAMPPSPALLRLNLALAEAGTPEGYRKYQRVAGSLPPQVMQAVAPARDLGAALASLTAEDIARIVTGPAGEAAAKMRGPLLDAMVSDLAKIPADANGLRTIQQARQGLARDYADVFTAAERKRLDDAVTARQAAIGDGIAAEVVAGIGQSSTGFEDGFADIEARSAPQLATLLTPAQAARIREAAEARRRAVADALYKDFAAELSKLPEEDASLDRIDRSREAIGRWPGTASGEAQRFRQAAEERRAAILAAVNRKEAGRMSGRVYQSANGQDKLEFVDRNRVLVTSGGHTMPANYVEEKDGRISITGENGMAVTLEREGRRLQGWSSPLARTR
jgi:hypothetical protein